MMTLHGFGLAKPSSGEGAGTPFLVLEYLRGHPLDALLDDGPLPTTRVVHIARQLADALSHAHARGIVHRDLKPSNLFIEADDHLKVMDLGIALLNTERQNVAERLGKNLDDLDEHLGNSPTVAGTPLYMAPEQFVADSQDHRCDLWAFGIVLYEMLTGRRPFAHPMEILRDGPPTIRDVPDNLAALIEACLQREVEHRIQHAKDILPYLDRVEATTLQWAATPSRTTNLSPSPDLFVGRAREHHQLIELIDSNARLITVLGPGGSGKTRLCQEFGLAQATRLDNIFFCDLSDARALDGIAIGVAQAIDVQLTQDDPIHQLGLAIHSMHRVLLIIDNFEQLVSHAQETLGHWLDAAPHASILVTSRHRLNLSAEHVVPLDPLRLPDTDTLDDIANNEAVRLFEARAKSMAQKFRISASNATDVAALVRALDGLPLAIELAAARVRTISPARMLKIKASL